VEKSEFLFDDQKERIAQELQQEAADTLMVEKLEMLKELAFNAENLQEVAQDLELEAKVSQPFSENGGTGVAASPVVVAAAYSPEVAEDGYASEVLDRGDDNYIVLRLQENFPSRQQSLEEVRKTVSQTLTSSISKDALDAKSAEITAALAAGESLEAVAQSFEIKREVVEAGQRSNRAVPPEVNVFAFDLPTPREGIITDDLTTANGDFVVVQLSEVTLGDSSATDEERTKLIRSIAESANSSKEFAAYQQALIEQAKIVQ
jgi:peptidyl-prolyl cis-trans isomerase D